VLDVLTHLIFCCIFSHYKIQTDPWPELPELPQLSAAVIGVPELSQPSQNCVLELGLAGGGGWLVGDLATATKSNSGQAGAVKSG